MIRKPVGENVLYPELSYSILQIAFEIQNQLGPGFTEDIYENAFIFELKNRGFSTNSKNQSQFLIKARSSGLTAWI